MSELLQTTTEIDKQHIITLFNTYVKGVEICLEGQNIKHCGKEGHWLETKMGIKHNAKNEPDINGYEMKNLQVKQHLEILVRVNMRFQKKETTLISSTIGLMR
jgi:hypothetical protein